MSDQINHECGISFLHLKRPLDFYRKKYGTSLYGINKMYLLMEKQHNRGQDGAGFASIKFDMSPGERYISRIRSAKPQPIQRIFENINDRINLVKEENPNILNETENLKKEIPYIGELMLGHVRYGTFGKNSIENVHPFLRQNNWMHRNLILAGNRLALAEGLLLGEKAGLNLDSLLTVIQDGACSSKTMIDKGPKMIKSDYSKQGQVKLSLKDSRLMLELGQKVGAPLLMTSIYSQIMQVALEKGYSEKDTVAFYEILRGMAGLEEREGVDSVSMMEMK